jgi:hypothetical protein
MGSDRGARNPNAVASRSVRFGAENGCIRAFPARVTFLALRRRRLRFARPETVDLRQIQVQLDNPALVASLLAFLRRQDCIVERVTADTLVVWRPPPHRNGSDAPQGELTCRYCGTPVAEALGRLGSLRCHDCRDEHHGTLLPGVYGLATKDGTARVARREILAYIAEWNAGQAEAVSG